ncbi:UDP-N-acetylmuramoyl-tripeptide--D-alanyl-D-alanine ligase [Paenibacillus rhizosphaerae]|uniref:UDP-N-acetylmuramoyl-tripeptide--D-alanyl-D-alanine ligase n=1 Tax=Paenibacillus rhizosphaerae TaxID=297318 RepID=A0A839TNZ4_9BACL|nr:UDP-N-acetylmuramoyl-tripeptide--D-alanyl-D-alanine ligase [Paenibacillus rhizosphaerae]MBB3128526.1 UDP-N-acetylmuramoyl-tripeptide--D-alanyl-D-alanine ligase [Paenibacillus rhizosphaerae]
MMITHELKVIERMSEGDGLSLEFKGLLIEGVSIDSRTVKPGNLFVPIIRELDGHNYVNEAISKGAIASFWQKDHPNPPGHLPLIYVDDCLEALQKLAAQYRQELQVKVIGVTGSNGKTTTKEMLNSVLQTKFRVYKTEGNLNSQVGVPLTILGINKDAEIAIIEMGMSERGQMEQLSRITNPDIAVITMIGVSHLSSLGSRETIAAAKLEIVTGLKNGGCFVFNGDEPLLTKEIFKIKKNSSLETISFGHGDFNDVIVESALSNSNGSQFSVANDHYYLPLLGAHNINNALATIAIALRLGLNSAEINEGFLHLKLPDMRLEKIISPSGFTIINDAWNASPDSVNAAIKTFQELTGYNDKHLVIGDMLELGDHEEEFHRVIGKNLDPDKINYIYTFGDLSYHIASEAIKRYPTGAVKTFKDKMGLANALNQAIKKNDVILLKASRGIQIDSIIPFLVK